MVLDLPTVFNTKPTSAPELQHFITSSSNDSRVVAFADRLCRTDGATRDERMLYAFCQQSLLECLTFDKSQVLASHLAIYHTRSLNPSSPSSGLTTLAIRDLLFAGEFYFTLFVHSYGGWVEGAQRAPLIRTSILHAAIRHVDDEILKLRGNPAFIAARRCYALGRPIFSDSRPQSHLESESVAEPPLVERRQIARQLAFYLTRECVPPPKVLQTLRALVAEAKSGDASLESATLRDVTLTLQVHAVAKVSPGSTPGLVWSLRALHEFMKAWR